MDLTQMENHFIILALNVRKNNMSKCKYGHDNEGWYLKIYVGDKINKKSLHSLLDKGIKDIKKQKKINGIVDLFLVNNNISLKK